MLEFLEIVFAEVEVLVGCGVEGENVVYGLEFRDGYETDLEVGQGRLEGWLGRAGRGAIGAR